MKKFKTYIKEALIRGHAKHGSKKEEEELYHPHHRDELFKNIISLLEKRIYNLNRINTSDITDMSFLFKEVYEWVEEYNRHTFDYIEFKNIDISKWNVSKVTNMYCMFEICHEFDCDLENWDVSNVTNMYSMFNGCENFTSDLSRWDVSKVTNMGYMFQNCSKFNSDLSRWDIRKVKSMSNMFHRCTNFNADLEKWNVKDEVNKRYMFNKCPLIKTPSWYKNENN